MSRPPRFPSQEQLSLFQPRPTRPQWTALPEELREQTIHLLARMLYEHRTRRHESLVGGEVSDE